LNDVAVPTRPGEKSVKLKIDAVSEHRAVVSPYPFDVDPLEFSFPARLVPKKSYESPEAFLEDFYAAERITISHILASS
jgi:hypothetical protein